MTHVVGRDGPELRLSAREVAVLWPAVRDWATAAVRVGATARMAELVDLLREWEQVAALYAERRVNAPPPDAMVGLRSHSRVMTTDQAATTLGCSTAHVRRLCARGQLDAQRAGRSWLIPVVAVAARKDNA